ncbi:MAG: flagellar hook-associated protein FlgL [Candidatus Zixiibacteriota bacterium]|nr:MAG: flagellar hook-associated protein FlgL [candidate division Zixibacteria bacterium]
MRVTTNMLTQRVSYNMHTALKRFLEMQTQMSSGRRINKPSDDPLGILRDLDYRTELSKNTQYLKNVSRGQDWVQTYDTVLAELKNMVSSTNELAIAMANEVADDDGTSRRAAAADVREIYDQIIQLANSELEDKTVFSGFRTDQRAIIASATGARYNGDFGQIEFQIDPSTDVTVNLIGADVFLKQLAILGETADLDVAVTAGTLLADLHNGDGVELSPGLFTITDRNLGITATVDASSCVTVQDVLDAINANLTAAGITNLEARIGDEQNNILLDTTANGLISPVTSLDVINGGNGIDLSVGKIRLTDYGATDVVIDFSGCSTIGDIINEFNSQVSAAGVNNVTMQINAAGTGFEINDTNGTPLGLSIIENDHVSSVATSLGILGPINPTLVGSDLEPTVSFEVAELGGTTAADLGILGEFFGDFAGSDLDPLLLPTSLVTDLNTGVGFDLSEIRVSQGERTVVLDLGSPSIVTVQDMLDAFNNCGLDITASINPEGRGIQIVNNDVTRSFIIEDVGEGTTSKAMDIFGSSDMLGTFTVLINSLERDDQDGVGRLLATLEKSMEHLVTHRATVGARGIRLNSTESRLLNRELTFTRRLSEVEDADITRLITDLAVYENNYQSALIAAAKIVQPSLLDFLT